MQVGANLTRTAYNFAFHETSLLSADSTVTYKKIDLVRTSLVAVLCEKTDDFELLKSLIECSVPKYASISVLIFTLNIKKSKVEDKLAIFGECLREKKISRVSTC
jgi:hypothetical protein